MVVYQVAILVLLTVILPLIIGTYWKGTVSDNSIRFTYLSGFFSILAIFEIIGVPMVIAKVSFRHQVVVYTIVLLLSIAVLVSREACRTTLLGWLESIRPAVLRKKLTDLRIALLSDTKKRYEVVYLIVFFGLLAYQVYYTLFYDVIWWTSDDGGYVVYSAEAIHNNSFFTRTEAGEFMPEIYDFRRALTAIYVFFSYCAYAMHMSVPMVEHTVYAILFLGMAYMAISLLAERLTKNKEEQYMFLCFVSLLHIFGSFSPYSMSFRLLATIWQGKAVLAVVILPLLLYVYPKLLEDQIHRRNVSFLVMLSLASVSLTLGGIVTMVMVPGVLSILWFIKSKKKEAWLYLVSGNLVSVGIGVYYFATIL